MMDAYFLSSGSHRTAKDGRCAMEWVSYLAGERHSDSPVCVSPLLTQFCISFNDVLGDEKRQRLRPYLARTIGTRGDGLDERRSWMAADWLIRVYTPTWLSLANLDEVAARLRELPPALTVENLGRAMAGLSDARRQAAAAWDAVRAAAWDAAWAAAWAAAWGAARGAAWGAAWAAAWGAAWDAARDAAWDAVWGAARDAAWDAVWGAARDAARAAARDAVWGAARDAARGAARDAARAALAPTVAVLQDSAFDLLDRMLPTEVIQLPVAADADLVCAG